MTRLTIVHTEASDAWGGQDIRVYKEALWFLEQGHDVKIFNPAHGEIFRRAQGDGLDITPVPFSKNTKVQDFFRMVLHFKRIKPDIVCTHSSVDSWVGLLAAKVCKVPVAVRYRHVSTPVRANFMNRWQYQGLCDHVVTTARAIGNDILEKFSLAADRISSVPTGIDPPDMPSRQEAKRQLLRRLGLPSNALLVGQVSVLRSWKGQYVLMDAFERLASRVPSSYLLLVGGGPVRDDYARRIRISPVGHRMLLVGHQENVWPFFRGLDVAVLSSTRNEGIPQAGLQAMFSACPFVGTDVGGIPEIVRHERTGLLARPGDAKSLADALIRALEHPHEADKMAQNALDMVREHYTIEHMGRRMENIFLALTAAAKGRRP